MEKEFKRTYELWAYGFDSNGESVPFSERIGTVAYEEKGRNALCKKVDKFTAKDLQEKYSDELAVCHVASVLLRVEELDLTDQEVEEEGGNCYYSREIDFGGTYGTKTLAGSFDPNYEYELWAIGYDENSFVVPMEEQIGETAIDEYEFLELIREAKEITGAKLKEMFADQIKKYNIKSIQIQIEELHNEDDEVLGEPIWEKQFDEGDLQ